MVVTHRALGESQNNTWLPIKCNSSSATFRASHVVTHRTTSLARIILTSEIGRDRVYYDWYDRTWWLWSFCNYILRSVMPTKDRGCCLPSTSLNDRVTSAKKRVSHDDFACSFHLLRYWIASIGCLGDHQEVRQCDFIFFASEATILQLFVKNTHRPKRTLSRVSGLDLRYLSNLLSNGRKLWRHSRWKQKAQSYLDYK